MAPKETLHEQLTLLVAYVVELNAATNEIAAEAETLAQSHATELRSVRDELEVLTVAMSLVGTGEREGLDALTMRVEVALEAVSAAVDATGTGSLRLREESAAMLHEVREKRVETATMLNRALHADMANLQSALATKYEARIAAIEEAIGKQDDSAELAIADAVRAEVGALQARIAADFACVNNAVDAGADAASAHEKQIVALFRSVEFVMARIRDEVEGSSLLAARVQAARGNASVPSARPTDDVKLLSVAGAMDAIEQRRRAGANAPVRVPRDDDGGLLFGAGGSERGVFAALASAVPFLRPSTQLEILKLLLSRRRKQRPYV